MLFHGEKAIDVAMGMDPYFSQVNIVGRNPDIDIAANEDIWDGGGDYTTFPAAALIFASSSSASDTTKVLTIVGLDALGNPQTATVTPAGQTKTALATLTWTAIFSVTSSAVLVGDAYVYEDDTLTAGVPNTSTKVRAKILATASITQMAVYTIPTGYDGLLVEYGGTQTNLQLWSIAIIGGALQYVENMPGYRQVPRWIPEGTFIKLRSGVSADNQDVRASAIIILRKK